MRLLVIAFRRCPPMCRLVVRIAYKFVAALSASTCRTCRVRLSDDRSFDVDVDSHSTRVRSNRQFGTDGSNGLSCPELCFQARNSTARTRA